MCLDHYRIDNIAAPIVKVVKFLVVDFAEADAEERNVIILSQIFFD